MRTFLRDLTHVLGHMEFRGFLHDDERRNSLRPGRAFVELC
jgi:hypothetical protein